jgi:DNA-binding transcriptional MerR regulator
MESHTLLEAAAVGRVLGITPATVRYLARAGRLRPVAVTAGGTRLFTAADVLAFRREREVQQAAREHELAAAARAVVEA